MKKEEVNKEMDDFAKKAMPLLREHGYLPKKTQEEYEYNYSAIWIAVAFIIGLMISGAFFYSSSKGWLKSNLTCPSIPKIDIPSCPNITIPTCPTPTCNVVCPSFPSNLSINLNNNS